MGIKSFHIVFIAASLAFCAFFAWWSGSQYLQAGGGFKYLIFTIVSLAGLAAGAPYLIWFIHKTKSF